MNLDREWGTSAAFSTVAACIGSIVCVWLCILCLVNRIVDAIRTISVSCFSFCWDWEIQEHRVCVYSENSKFIIYVLDDPYKYGMHIRDVSTHHRKATSDKYENLQVDATSNKEDNAQHSKN